MRIGVNLAPLLPGKIGGMETYVRNLLKHMALVDSKNKYFLFTTTYNNDTFDFPNSNFKKILIDSEISQYQPRKINKFEKKLLKNRLFSKFYKKWQGYIINKSARFFSEQKLDIWFCPHTSLNPRFSKIPTLVTIPDIQHEYYPQFFTPDEIENREDNWKQSCFDADQVLTISECSKKTLIDKYQLSPQKINVTLLSVANEFKSLETKKDKQVVQKYALPSNYAFYPANTWPHKNHKLLIIGFAYFKKHNKSDLKLVLSGIDDAKQELDPLIEHFGINDDVLFLSYIERIEMPIIYRNAMFLIFPSLFEGFGIPLLEAMACDCPIAASKLTSIPEVAGKAALYFDPRNPVEISRAFEKMTNDSSLRNNLAEEGRNQLNNFSWDRTAKQTINVFEELWENHNGR